jgi:23S rRNA (uracil-5-)-methyltransferase RumA
MKYGHKIHLDIQGYDEKGRGFGEIDIVPGELRRVIVPFTAQGDEAEAVFVKREYRVKIGKLDNLIQSGPDRIKAPCPHAGTCGGCLWQHLEYEAQLKEKERGIRDLFSSLDLEPAIRPIIPADQQLGYRNRMDFCVGWNSEIGLKEYGSWNRYVNINECLLLKPGIREILQFVRDWMKASDLQPWDAKFFTGDVRYVVVRDGQNTKQRMITLVVRDASRIDAPAKKKLVVGLKTFCTTLLIGEQPKNTDISLAESFEAIVGDPWIEEDVNGLRYRIHPNSFFQTNTSMAARLQQTVLDEIRNSKFVIRNLLDLYCGIGFFGIAAAQTTKKLQVTGYELDEEAIKLASQNAEMNKVGDRCRFFSGKAEELTWKDVDAQCVILDPPRSGLHPRVIKTLLDDTVALQPRSIVYVSCNYRRLKEELPLLMQKFEVTSIQPLDLFPQTPHVEVVVSLNRHNSP